MSWQRSLTRHTLFSTDYVLITYGSNWTGSFLPRFNYCQLFFLCILHFVFRNICQSGAPGGTTVRFMRCQITRQIAVNQPRTISMTDPTTHFPAILIRGQIPRLERGHHQDTKWFAMALPATTLFIITSTSTSIIRECCCRMHFKLSCVYPGMPE